MMRREFAFTFLLALLTIGFISCETDDFDNTGPTTLEFQIEALNKSYSLPVNSSGMKSVLADSIFVEWDSAHLVVSYTKFEAELKSLVTHKDSIEISYKWSGPQLVDLFNPDLTFGNFLLQPGFYDEIEIQVKGEKEDADDMPVFYMHGMFTGSTAVLPVEVRINKDVTFKTEQDSVEVTEENLELISYIQIYLDELMAKVEPHDLDNAKLTDGVIVISEDSNRNIYYTIMGNLVKDQYCNHYYKNKKKKYYKDHDD